MAITADQLIKEAERRGKVIPSDKPTNANNILATIDQVAIQTEEEGKLIQEIWDRISPINGVSAETVLANRTDVDPNGEVYLIKDKATGQVIFFQPHEPDVQGLKRMTKTNALTVADTHRKKVAASRADARAMELAIAKI